jgi:hypothetical protein
MSAPTDIGDVRFWRAVEQQWRLGPRALAAFLDELGAEHLIRTEIELKLRWYSRLDADTVRAVGGDRFPPPLTLLPRR